MLQHCKHCLPLCLFIILFISCNKSPKPTLPKVEGQALTVSDSIAELTRLLEKNPDNSDYLYKRAYQYYRANKMDKAFDDLNKAMVIDPKNDALFHLRGFFYKTLKRDDEALKDFEYASYLSSVNPETYYEIGNIYVLKNQIDKAFKPYDHAIKLDPKDPQYEFAKAYAYRLQKNTDQAITTCLKSLDKDSSFIKSLNLLFEIYINDKKDFNRASFYNVSLLKQHPKNSLGHFNLGILFFMQYQAMPDKESSEARQLLSKSVAAYSKAIELQADFSRAYYQRGFVLTKVPELDNATKDFLKSIEIDPNNAPAYFMLGAINEGFKETEQARMYYQKALALNPNLTEAKIALQQLR